MISLSFNIIKNNVVINTIPYLYVSDDITKLFNEIRNISLDIIKEQFKKYNITIDISEYNLSMVIFSNNPIIVHFINIQFDNIKKIKYFVIEENAKRLYKNI